MTLGGRGNRLVRQGCANADQTLCSQLLIRANTTPLASKLRIQRFVSNVECFCLIFFFFNLETYVRNLETSDISLSKQDLA